MISNIEIMNSIPILLLNKIKVLLLSNKTNYFLNSQDIYEILINELYFLYKKLYLENYKPPYKLTFITAECCKCKKNILNECYSELIHHNYGWNHCKDCEKYIKIWMFNYMENSNYYPISYINELKNFNDIISKTLNIKNNGELELGIIYPFINYLKLDKEIIKICILLKNNTTKWISLKEIKENNKSVKNLKYKVPEYYSKKNYILWLEKMRI